MTFNEKMKERKKRQKERINDKKIRWKAGTKVVSKEQFQGNKIECRFFLVWHLLLDRCTYFRNSSWQTRGLPQANDIFLVTSRFNLSLFFLRCFSFFLQNFECSFQCNIHLFRIFCIKKINFFRLSFFLSRFSLHVRLWIVSFLVILVFFFGCMHSFELQFFANWSKFTCCKKIFKIEKKTNWEC